MRPSDIADVNALMKGRVIDFTQRLVLVVENDAHRIVGALLARNVFYMDGFKLDAGANNRLAAEVLLNYAFALGQVGLVNPKARPEAAFVVDKDNDQMRRFVEAYGAEPDDDHEGRIYTMELL